jgi:type VI secretion system protein ImpA
MWPRGKAVPLPRPDLLNPIPGPNPSGENLRYAPIYDKIKLARTEDDDTAPQGEWQRERKKADWALVMKLAGEALATKSKDLMLASWLGEALVKREGISGLADALDLQRGLIEQYWDNLYPEKDDDGDLGLRVMPVEFIATRSQDLLRKLPLTKNGLDWFKYMEAKAVGMEADATSDQKVEARNTARILRKALWRYPARNCIAGRVGRGM